MSDITIFHNPQCGTSRSVLALIRASGAEPRIVEYLKTPPSAAELRALARATGEPLRALLRTKQPEVLAQGLDDHGGHARAHRAPDRGGAARHAAVSPGRPRAGLAAAPGERLRAGRNLNQIVFNPASILR